MINAGAVTVKAERLGRECVLRIVGELDAVTAGEFAAQAARALQGGTGRLVLDLSGLRFADCCGARALAAVADASAVDGPVIVHAAQSAVAGSWS